MSDWKIDHIVEAIETLYSTNNSKQVQKLQDVLLPVQKSSNADHLAQLLLKHPSKHCKYFGALTYAVFITTHFESTDKQVALIVDDLLGSVLALAFEDPNEYDGNLFIIKKLLSDLSLVYITHNTQDPVTLLTNKFLPKPLDQSVHFLSEKHINLIIMFSSIVVEDICKKESVPNQVHESIATSLFPTFNTILIYLLNRSEVPPSTNTVCLNAINSWVMYISYAETNSNQRYTEVANLVHFILKELNRFAITVENIDTLNSTFTVLTEVLETNPRMLNDYKAALNAIFFAENNLGLTFVSSIVQNPEKHEEYSDEVENYINLLIAYLNWNLLFLTRNILNDEVFRIFNIILLLTDYPGLAITEEKISEQFLPFWEEVHNMFADDAEVVQNLMGDQHPDYLVKRDDLLTRVAFIYWRKCLFYENAPPEFVHYRLQVSELFILLYSILSEQFYSIVTQHIADILVQCQSKPTAELLIDIEASVYFMFKITDDLTFYDDDSTSALVPNIHRVFQHQLIQTVEHSISTVLVEQQVHQIHVTMLNYLTSIQFFFSTPSGSEYLISTFEFLFSIILNNKGNLALIASKTVLKICQNTKESLAVFLPNLEVILKGMLGNIEIDNLIRERMINSYVSIAHSVKDPVKFGDVIYSLLVQINEMAVILMSNPSSLVPKAMPQAQASEQLEDYALSLLACINEIGKASQLPEEILDYFTPEQLNQNNLYWQQDPHNIKESILMSLNQLSINFDPLANNTMVTERCCNILKNGLTEPVDGPFKFTLESIVGYLTTKIDKCNSDSIPYIYKLVETIIITNGSMASPDAINGMLQDIFVKKMALIAEDIDLIKASIDLFATIIERYPSLLVHLPIFKGEIINFALLGLKYHETFIIKASGKFWINLLNLKRGNAEDCAAVQALFLEQMVGEGTLGFTFTDILLSSFLDNPRSNLDQFYQVFRRLIGKFPLQLKTWLKVSLSRQEKHPETNINHFINKLMLTRGQRQANDVLKQFWLEHNGLIDYRK